MKNSKLNEFNEDEFEFNSRQNKYFHRWIFWTI
jgi:hypothetical protein